MDWLGPVLLWYVVLFIIGLCFLPITRRLFGSFIDGGYPFSRAVGILVLSYFAFVFGFLRIVPFSQANLILLLVFFALVNLYVFKKFPTGKRFHRGFVIFEEALFFIALLFLSFTRGQEPSIHGLEKFMDFGFINSILRSNYFPPVDIWYASSPINYYYFGHLTGAVLIKLIGTPSFMGYNLILAAIFAQSATIAFSLTANLVYVFQKIVGKVKKPSAILAGFYGLLGSFIMNLGGNLHTIYLFTKGYPNDQPVPFWTILSGFNPVKYWYPNATRFIPYTIHEFPSYSYVVADIHGHVFDIPFVLLTLALLFVLFIQIAQNKSQILNTKYYILYSILFGFLTAVHYMTNAFDGPIYFLIAFIVSLAIFGISLRFLKFAGLMFLSFLLFSLPFTANFKPFATRIGVNCSPAFLTSIDKLGLFLFEKDKCQTSPLWMLFILWGFFLVCFFIFTHILFSKNEKTERNFINPIDTYIFILFFISSIFIMIPELFYIKDIYPAHFRANTMFKLGYQAFIMMAIASAYTAFRIRLTSRPIRYFYKGLYSLLFFLVFLYPFFSFPSYYGVFNKKPSLDGRAWIVKERPEDAEIINYLNKNVSGQPVIIEAQGDSYTDYERISSYTGLPTVGGWLVHEWLWRGPASILKNRIFDITAIYESSDSKETKRLLDKYDIKYIVVSSMERGKYKNIKEAKFSLIGMKIFESTNKLGALYQVK